MNSAIISDCGNYRYRLARDISEAERRCLFIMLNPSKADASVDDPTIRRCINFAKRWGCGELIVVNLFAYRATKISDMKQASDPIGPGNMDHILQAVEHTMSVDGLVICAWGNDGGHKDQDKTVLGRLGQEGIQTHCLKVNNNGQPAHPARLLNDLEPILYHPVESRFNGP
jgi:hypothetical protein